MKILAKENRLLIFQISIFLVFTFSLPFFGEDIIRVVKKKEQVIYIGIFCCLAIISEIVGGFIKSKFISNKNLKYPVVSSFFFLLFLLIKLGVFLGIVYITPIALTGMKNIDENIFVRIPTTLISFFIIFIFIKQLTTIRNNENIQENDRLEIFADILLFISGFFFFTISWFTYLNDNYYDVYPLTVFSIFNGIIIYISIYMSSYFYFYFDHITSIKTKKGLLIYWLGIVGISITVLLEIFPV